MASASMQVVRIVRSLACNQNLLDQIIFVVHQTKSQMMYILTQFPFSHLQVDTHAHICAKILVDGNILCQRIINF